MARYGQNARAITHNNVFALADYLKTGLLQRSNSFKVIDAGNLLLY